MKAGLSTWSAMTGGGAAVTTRSSAPSGNDGVFSVEEGKGNGEKGNVGYRSPGYGSLGSTRDLELQEQQTSSRVSTNDKGFSTYPETYDLLYVDHLFSKLKKRCELLAVFAEVDRELRLEIKLIVWNAADTMTELESMTKSLKWEVRMTYTKGSSGGSTWWRALAAAIPAVQKLYSL
ncbi:hypothetical protein PR202_gb07672 [Eleusine coracana subsp. coracana]|uniref:Methyltransferase n=1 Tax=Eleusine coracana subsp. coracana TaxID=191504 RepID=A0AAV5EAA1_ELECO|nr:hypothetical protein PR202_gb07672 [Eleusine coracana subsp. coracana]